MQSEHLYIAGQWWCTPLIPALRRQRQADLSVFEASLVHKMDSRTSRTVTQRNPVSQKQNKQTKTTCTHKLSYKNLKLILNFTFIYFSVKRLPCTHSVDQDVLEFRDPPGSGFTVMGWKACATMAIFSSLFWTLFLCPAGDQSQTLDILGKYFITQFIFLNY